MVLGDRLAGLSISETRDFPTQPSPGMVKKLKYPVGGKSLSENALLMPKAQLK